MRSIPWPFERRIALLVSAVASVAAICGIALILLLAHDAVWRTVLTVILFALVSGLALALRAAVREPLRALTNVVEAYRGGDYTIRSSRHARGDVLGDLVHEINSLGDGLHEERLRAVEATALLDKLIGEIDVAVLAFDGEGRLRVHNAAAARLLQFRPSALGGQTAAELRLESFLGEAARTQIVTTLAGRGGRWQITHGTFREGGLAQHLLLIADVQQALREEERLAWQRLIRVIGHEVNNSLTPIRSLAQSLKATLTKRLAPGHERDETLGGLQVIVDRSRTLGQFLAQYSRLARLPPPRRRWLRLTPLITRVTALEALDRIRIDVSDDLEGYVDEDQFEQALINLARNAIEATEGVGGEVVIAASARHEDLIITVADDGPGVANPDNLFVPFFTTKPGGSGVGLVLSRQIAEAHGGTLSLENRRESRGAVATLEVPRAARNRSLPPEASAPPSDADSL